MSWMLSLYKKSGSETSNTASVKKAQATSLPILKPKSQILLSEGRFLWKDEAPDSAGASFWDF